MFENTRKKMDAQTQIYFSHEMTTDLLANISTTLEPPWVFDDYPQRLIVASSLILITVWGLIGNISTIIAVFLSRKLMTKANVFVVNLSVAGALACATLPFTVANMIHNQSTSIVPPVGCAIAGIMSYVSFSGTIVAHVLIAIDRVVRITTPNHKYRRIIRKRTIVPMIILAWFYASLSVILAIITHVEFGYSTKYRVCLPDIVDANVATVSIFRATTIDLLILICVFVCYTVIFVYIYRHNKKLLGMHKLSKRVVRLSKRRMRGSKAAATRNDREKIVRKEEDVAPISGHDDDISLPERGLSGVETNTQGASFGQSVIMNGVNPAFNRGSDDRESSDDETSSSTSGTTEKRGAASSVDTSNVQNRAVRPSAVPSTHHVRLRSQLNARQVRITMNMFLVVAVYIVCITPYIACLIIDSLERIFPFVAVFYALSNAINPVIYAWKHPQFRRVFKPMVHCRWSEIPEPTWLLKTLRNRGR